MIALWLAACAPESEGPAPKTHAPAPLAPLPATVTKGGSGEAVDVRLSFSGVSRMYRHYFGEVEFTEPLARALGDCFDEWTDVVVSYDNETRQGRIFVQTPHDRLRCTPLVTPDGLDVRPLAPVGQALATYRDALAGNRDVRLANFATGLRVVEGVNICDVWTAGQFPPDGTTFSACVTLQGHDVCDGDRNEGHLRIPWPAKRAETLRACFD